MCGLGPGIALGSTRVYLSLWRDPRYSSLYFPGATSPVCPGLPNEPLRQRMRCKVGSIVCSLTQRIHFLSYLVFSNQIFQFCSFDFDSHPPSHNQISPQVDDGGFRVRLTRVSHSPRLTRLEIKVWGQSWWGNKPLHSNVSITIVLFRVRTRRTEQHYNVPVLRYRTPFEYAGQTPYMNDKCAGWARASP